MYYLLSNFSKISSKWPPQLLKYLKLFVRFYTIKTLQNLERSFSIKSEQFDECLCSKGLYRCDSTWQCTFTPRLAIFIFYFAHNNFEYSFLFKFWRNFAFVVFMVWAFRYIDINKCLEFLSYRRISGTQNSWHFLQYLQNMTYNVSFSIVLELFVL